MSGKRCCETFLTQALATLAERHHTRAGAAGSSSGEDTPNPTARALPHLCSRLFHRALYYCISPPLLTRHHINAHTTKLRLHTHNSASDTTITPTFTPQLQSHTNTHVYGPSRLSARTCTLSEAGCAALPFHLSDN